MRESLRQYSADPLQFFWCFLIFVCLPQSAKQHVSHYGLIAKHRQLLSKHLPRSFIPLYFKQLSAENNVRLTALEIRVFQGEEPSTTPFFYQKLKASSLSSLLYCKKLHPLSVCLSHQKVPVHQTDVLGRYKTKPAHTNPFEGPGLNAPTKRDELYW